MRQLLLLLDLTYKQHVRSDRTSAEQELLGCWRGAEGIAEIMSKGQER